MANILSKEALAERARNLGALNGFKLVFVSLTPAAAPTDALLDVEFQNAGSLPAVLNDINVGGIPPTTIFPLRGGTRLIAGDQPGQVQVVKVQAGATPEMLRLVVRPIGDYSTYTLGVSHGNDFDPLFSEIEFKFRPGCFNLNCAPVGAPEARPAEPAIDYLARDYDSLKHVLINAMRDRVPEWAPTSEADLDQVLIDLMAAEGDELADYQDRVMNEAYIARVRKRVALARHGRLMDYHLQEGNQADTLLALKISIPSATIAADFGVWSGTDWKLDGAVIFKAARKQPCKSVLNEMQLYTWNGVVTALEAGSTAAEIALPAPLNPALQADADDFVDLLRSGDHPLLLIEQKLNPETGGSSGVDKSARQIVTLLQGAGAAERVFDPLAGQFLVRVHWRPEDRLKRRYCFITDCTGQPPTTGVSAFHGNLMRATEGRPYRITFRPPGTVLGPMNSSNFLFTSEAQFETTRRWGTIFRLPEGPLAYLEPPAGGETPPRSTLRVTALPSGDVWTEQTDLIESESEDQDFIVETDEARQSLLRFGNGVNGMAWNVEESGRVEFQVGGGAAGNVGPDALVNFDRGAFPAIMQVWNPLDVTNGRDPEPAEDARRRIPEAYRARQLRAVTLSDYVKRARELPEVSNAYARYAWTGSWRTVRVLIDPADTEDLSDSLRARLEQHLDAVRLIGEDLEIRGAQFVALDIKVRVCVHKDYWPEDLRNELELEFSSGYTADGRPGFFNPNLWTFGQPLYASQIVGRALAVTGVDRVLLVAIRRWDGLIGPHTVTVIVDPGDGPSRSTEKIEVRPFEIIRVDNDPSQMEHGRIRFEMEGGRQ